MHHTQITSFISIGDRSDTLYEEGLDDNLQLLEISAMLTNALTSSSSTHGFVAGAMGPAITVQDAHTSTFQRRDHQALIWHRVHVPGRI